MANKVNNGVVFTREWVVEFILECCGYIPSRDLSRCLIVEPSCGHGAFLLPIVKRLLESVKIHQREAIDIVDSIRAFELDAASLNHCREELHLLLFDSGISQSDTSMILDNWLIEGDYLLYESFHWADFIVGNPPYIRAMQIDQQTRKEYMKACPTMSLGTDIYIGFFEMGLRSLKPEGVLSFICADRWMHNAYGKKLRSLISREYSVEMILKMHNVDAFESNVSAYPAITQISNSAQNDIVYAVLEESFSAESTSTFTDWLSDNERNRISHNDFSGHWIKELPKAGESWPLASSDELLLLERLNANFHPLQDNCKSTQVGIGIATGRDDVFVLTDPSLVEDSLLLPLVTSSQTRDGAIERQDIWLFNPWNADGSLIDLNQYPKANAYLSKRQDVLRSRHIVKNGNGKYWYRTIDKVYPDLTSKPKLLIQDMKSRIEPVYDKGDYYPHHNLYWVTSDRWNLEVLGGLLISDIVKIIIEAYCVKMRGGTLRLQAQYLRKIRLPDPDIIEETLQAGLTEAFRERDRVMATEIAKIVYNVEGIIT